MRERETLAMWRLKTGYSDSTKRGHVAVKDNRKRGASSSRKFRPCGVAACTAGGARDGRRFVDTGLDRSKLEDVYDRWTYFVNESNGLFSFKIIYFSRAK